MTRPRRRTRGVLSEAARQLFLEVERPHKRRFIRLLDGVVVFSCAACHPLKTCVPNMATDEGTNQPRQTSTLGWAWRATSRICMGLPLLTKSLGYRGDDQSGLTLYTSKWTILFTRHTMHV